MPIPSGHIKDSRSGLDFTAKADPHPLKAPGIATHSVKVDNQRQTAVYQVGTAVGTCPRGQALRRVGAHAGDLVVSIGHGGIFWRDVLTIRNGGSLPEPTGSPLFRPRSQLSAMLQLSNARKITAAIDNSDGPIPSLSQLAPTR
jgi:thiamine monophosphate kinase